MNYKLGIMRRLWMMALIVTMVMIMSCGSSRPVEREKTTVLHLKADTVWALDSVMVHDSVHVAVMGDTVREYKERTVWRDRVRIEVRTDTLMSVDTLVIERVERPPDAADDNGWIKSLFVLGALVVLIWVYRLRR